MEIIVDPADPQKIKLVKHPRSMRILAGVILASGVIFAILIKNLLWFVPFVAVVGVFYIFSGNYFEISVNYTTGEIYRKSHDMFHLTEFYRAVKIEDVQKIWLSYRDNRGLSTSVDLILVLKDRTHKKLCSASYGSDREELRKFGFVLSELVKKDFDAGPQG